LKKFCHKFFLQIKIKMQQEIPAPQMNTARQYEQAIAQLQQAINIQRRGLSTQQLNELRANQQRLRAIEDEFINRQFALTERVQAIDNEFNEFNAEVQASLAANASARMRRALERELQEVQAEQAVVRKEYEDFFKAQ